MNINDILAEIINDIADGKELDLSYYCSKYPDYKEVIKEKLRIASFIKKGLTPEDLSGKKLGEYYLIREIGRGGMGIVYLAIHSRLSRLTAIKVLPSHFLADKQALKNFQEEAKIIAKFNHPNIVPIYSIDEDIGIHYISMGYVPGVTLKELLEKLREQKIETTARVLQIRRILSEACDQDQTLNSSITLKRDEKFWTQSYANFVATLGKEISSALNYAHENGICHGDIKPSNILLTRDAIPMIVDFGLSRSFKGMPQLKSDEFAGTLAYAAPEQIKSSIINQKTDIWSVGATLYELLTLKNPFVSNTTKKTGENVLNGNPPLLRAIDKKIPIELEAITLKCLEKKPEARYPSTEDLAKDLNNYLELRPISAKPYGVFKRIHKAILRKPVSALLILLLIPTIALASILGINKTIDYYFGKATTLLNQNKTKEAFDIFDKLNKISKVYPYGKDTTTESLIEIGRYCCNNQDYDRALKAIESARMRKPKDFRILIGLGYCYHGKGLYEEAIKAYKQGLIIYPDNTELEKAIADVLYAQKVRVEDIKDFVEFNLKWSFSKNEALGIQRALWSDYKQGGELASASTADTENRNRIDQKSVDILASLNAASKLCQVGLYDEAIAIYTKEIASNPSDWKFYADRGRAYAQGKKDYDKALADYNKAVELAPFSDIAHTGRAATYSYKGDLDKALEDYNISLELNPKSFDTYIGRGYILQKKGSFDKAINDYTKAIDLDKNNPAPYIHRATAYYDKKYYKKAWDDVKKAQSLKGQVPSGFIDALRKASGRQE